MSAVSPSQTVFSIGYDFHWQNSDYGNVFAITNNRDANRSQTFSYDALNRLASAQNAGTDCSKLTLHPPQTQYWGNTYTYDAWGNLREKVVTKCSSEPLSVTLGATNRILNAGYGYDAAGNMTLDGTDAVSATYDAENRIATAGKGGVTTAYIYDADGNRVEKLTPPPPATPSDGTIYWYMTPGIVAESDLSGALKSEYVFFNGDRVARRDFGPTGPTGVFYYFSDHLKTASVITDDSGNIKSDSDFYPWGGELQFVANDSNHYKFTGKERDTETGLDYLGARYYSNGLGRFITPDWAAKAAAVPYADFADPQSLNLYTYVRNVPTTTFDKDGHVIIDPKAIASAIDKIASTSKDVVAGLAKGGANFFIKWDNGIRDSLNKIGAHYDKFPIKEFKPSNATQAKVMKASEVATAVVVSRGRGEAEPLPDDALVVRGGSGEGANSVEGIAKGTGTHPSGVTGFSAESAPGKSVEQLVQESPTTARYGEVGCCTVEQVREAGGDVISTKGQSPNHATVTGITPEQANRLLTPTVKNPVKK